MRIVGGGGKGELETASSSELLLSVGARWDEDLHMLAFAFKTAVHESTQFNPAKLFRGVGYSSGGGVRFTT
jgi:hypothetical protein